MEEITGPLQDKLVVESATKYLSNHISKLVEDANDMCRKDELTNQELKELNIAMQ